MLGKENMTSIFLKYLLKELSARHKIRWDVYLEIVLLERWKHSPRCLIDRPVTHAYRNIASCS